MAFRPNLSVGTHTPPRGIGMSDIEAKPSPATTVQGVGARITVRNTHTPVKSMAYGNGGASSVSAQPVSTSSLYRVERGFPYYRRGRLITVNPQFRSLNIIAQNKGSVASTSFTTTNTNVTVAYPKKVV